MPSSRPSPRASSAGPRSRSCAAARSRCRARSPAASVCSSTGTPRRRSARCGTRSCIGRRIFSRRGRWRSEVLVVMKTDATKEEIDGVVRRITDLGLSAIPLPGAERTAIGTFGVAAREYADQLESLPGVAEIVLVSRPFKLSSREVHPSDSVVRVGGVPIGGGQPLAVMAGPCSVETREQTVSTARAVRTAGASLFRGGAYKPSTSPYSFRGLGPSGLDLLSEARAATGLPVVTEVLTPADVELVA